MIGGAKRGRKPGSKTGPTGPRKGSQADWLASFTLGETRLVEAKPTKAHWKTHPPIPAKSRRTDNFTFQAARYCAVPQSNLTDEPIYIWRITRTG